MRVVIMALGVFLKKMVIIVVFGGSFIPIKIAVSTKQYIVPIALKYVSEAD